MESTKHDLSYDEVKLDYEALVKTAEIAVGRTLNNINKYLGKIRSAWDEKDWTGLYLNCGWLEQEAKRMNIAGETLSALKGGLTRRSVIIMNKPEIKEEKKEVE